jgi:ribosome-binding factor A
MASYNANYGNGRSSSRHAAGPDRTKRQERVGHVVRAELAAVLHRGDFLENGNRPLEAALRRRINVISVDVSPDLRQARVTVSVMGGAGGDARERRGSDTVAKRRAYAWLVRNTKAIRYALAAKMKHMRGGSPDLTFVQVDVGAAVDVMQLIERVNEGYKREDLGMGFVEKEEGEWDEEEGEGEDDGWFDFDEEGNGISVEVQA